MKREDGKKDKQLQKDENNTRKKKRVTGVRGKGRRKK